MDVLLFYFTLFFYSAATIGHLASDRAYISFYAVVFQHFPGHQHPLADKVGDELIGRPVIQVIAGIVLFDNTVVHDADFIGHDKGSLHFAAGTALSKMWPSVDGYF